MSSAVRERSSMPQAPKSPLMRVGIGLFALGVLAIVVVFALFAFGLRNLPLWLSLAAGVATPAGLLLGLTSLVREARSRKSATERE